MDCCATNSIGKPIKDVEITVVDEQGRPVPTRKHGLVHVNTPSIFLGYVSGRIKQRTLNKGWLNTGDVGYIDKNGELHIVNRVSELIILDAQKIYPSEIKKKILDCNYICESVVVKIEYDNRELLACLYTGKNKPERDMRNELKKKLPRYEITRRFINKKI